MPNVASGGGVPTNDDQRVRPTLVTSSCARFGRVRSLARFLPFRSLRCFAALPSFPPSLLTRNLSADTFKVSEGVGGFVIWLVFRVVFVAGFVTYYTTSKVANKKGKGGSSAATTTKVHASSAAD